MPHTLLTDCAPKGEPMTERDRMNESEQNAGTPEQASSLHEVILRMWKVTVERTLIVMAADERAAERAATYYAREEDSEPELVSARCVSRVDDIPLEWRDGIPWGGARKDDRTCSQRMDSQNDPSSATSDAGPSNQTNREPEVR